MYWLLQLVPALPFERIVPVHGQQHDWQQLPSVVKHAPACVIHEQSHEPPEHLGQLLLLLQPAAADGADPAPAPATATTRRPASARMARGASSNLATFVGDLVSADPRPETVV
jgi:hypothetical protein